MNSQRAVVTTVAVTTTSLLALIWWYKKMKKVKIPTEWKAVGKLSALHMYPLKSGYRLEIEEGECTKYGLKQINKSGIKLRDRFLVVYNRDQLECKTGMNNPKMVLIEVSNHGSDQIALNAPNMQTVHVKLPEIKEKDIITITLDDKEPVNIVDCGNEAATWLSKYVLDKDSGLRIGYQNESINDRTVNRRFNKVFPNYKDYDMGIFSGCSYMLINQASVNDLNTRLEEQDVTATRFRPNFIVEHMENLPYLEDSWNWIKIGDTIFQNIMPCTRCIFTNIDAESGIRDVKGSTLKKLKEYRQIEETETRKIIGNAPLMGINLGLRKAGKVKVNDTVYVG